MWQLDVGLEHREAVKARTLDRQGTSAWRTKLSRHSWQGTSMMKGQRAMFGDPSVAGAQGKGGRGRI